MTYENKFSFFVGLWNVSASFVLADIRIFTVLYKQRESDEWIVGGSTRNWCCIYNASSGLAFNQIPVSQGQKITSQDFSIWLIRKSDNKK